jgi:hypothetical protein
MRHASKIALVVAAMLPMLGGVAAAAPAPGLTITPAALSVTLAKDTPQQTAAFTITNTYNRPVEVQFTIEPAAGQPGAQANNLAKYITIAHPAITVEAGATFHQTLTVHNSPILSPGSQTAELVTTQSGQGGALVGVLPAVRLPLIIIKEDGAVAGLQLQGLTHARFGLSLPDSAAPRISNTGNVIAIPRGVVTINGPGGAVVRQGALNVASAAIAPGGTQTIASSLAKTNTAHWPGIYRTTVQYGLGGGQRTGSYSTWFFYAAWWHVALFVGIALGTYYGLKRLRRSGAARASSAHAPPGKLSLFRRGRTT